MKKEHQELFQPIKIGGVEIKNRYVMSPMADFGLVDKQGVPTDAGVEYFVRRAQGGIGLILTLVGLMLFLTGVNVGFSPLGFMLGQMIAQTEYRYMLIPLSALMGWFIINAEPAVHVLNKQVEELSAGAISARAMGLSLSIGVAAAMGLSMVRALTGISILWFIVPGYLLSLALTFLVPSRFTAIAFDSGGVASGPLTAAFMLPFAIGAVQALHGNVMTDAFGLVSLVAMMPLITVQVMGVIAVISARVASGPRKGHVAGGSTDVIELWEV